jgi:hypothetical protein
MSMKIPNTTQVIKLWNLTFRHIYPSNFWQRMRLCTLSLVGIKNQSEKEVFMTAFSLRFRQ